jgi:hypothetical protein
MLQNPQFVVYYYYKEQKMKNITLFILILFIVSGLFAQQNIPLKYALVIGNAAYTGDWGRLDNPINDATAIYDVLKDSLKFDEVIILCIATRDQIRMAILNFSDKLKTSKGAYGFFFYAGHGAQYTPEHQISFSPSVVRCNYTLHIVTQRC